MYIEVQQFTDGVSRYVIGHGGRYELWALVIRCGDDISVTIGNDCAHVGATAMGCPRPVENGVRKKASVSSLCALAHRDDHMARLAAELLATKIDKRVSVTAGVHIDNAEKKEIELLLSECRELCEFIAQEEGNRV